jgi:hypothetical protein
MGTDWDEIFKEREEREEKRIEILSNILYSYERMYLTKDECEILSKEILIELRENGLLGSEPPIG